MTTDEGILEEMLERSTNPDREVDNMAVQMFCMVVKSNRGGGALVKKAHELIVKKIRSNNTTEASRAIAVLEECMSKGGEEFQTKTSRFTFLNELIALVIDRHNGPPVPDETKKRIIECFLLWTAEHPDKTKIQEAYDSLITKVNFKQTPSPSLSNDAKEQRSSILGKDDELVAKLLKQGGEQNYKRANLVIQHRFNQEARRTEFICHLKSELMKIEQTMEVLEEMLNSYSITDTPADTKDTMEELYNTCKSHYEQMARWPDFLSDSDPKLLEDVLTTKDQLMAVLDRHRQLFESDLANKPINQVETSPKLLNVVTQNTNASTSSTATTNSDILSELIGDVTNPSSSSRKTSNRPDVKENNDVTMLDELNEIFGSIDTKTEPINYPSDLLGNFDLLEPINVLENQTKTKKECETQEPQQPQAAFKELREIDKLSEEIFKQNLQTEQRQPTFKKEPEKVTLNDLVKDKMQTSLKTNNSTDKIAKQSSLDIKENLKSSLGLTPSPTPDDSIAITSNKLKKVEQANVKMLETKNINVEEKINNNESVEANVQTSLPVKPLSEIEIELDELTPVIEGRRMLLDDEDIQVTLNFTTDCPSAHVSVIVMTVTNKSRLPVKDFQFEASVKKPCKVRLLPPTDTTMSPRKPFRPPEPINQILLLMNPTQKAVDITCIVGYKLGNDPDPIKESIVAKDIPFA